MTAGVHPDLFTAAALGGAWLVLAGNRPATRRRVPTPGPARHAPAPPPGARALRGAGRLLGSPTLPLQPVALRRARARRGVEVARELPELVDLVHVAVTAGLTPALALVAARDHAPPRLRAELDLVLAEVTVGSSLADALSRLPARAGEPTRPLVAVLVDALRYGTPIGAALDRLAADARSAERRRAEERARRVPVLLLFPLVTCILPAFGLLTVVPLVAGGVRALHL